MEYMDSKITAWLQGELDDRGWSHRELARRIGMSQTAVSTVIAGEREAGWEFLARVASALNEDPETIFRLAGRLPQVKDLSDNAKRLLRAMEYLDPEIQQVVVEFAEWQQYKQKKSRS